jgi:hypothetical protein
LKRFGYLVLALALLTSACSARTSETASEGDGIAALDRSDANMDGASSDGGAKAEKKKGKSVAGKSATKKEAGSSSSKDTSSSTSSENNAASAQGGENSGAQPALPIPRGTHSYDTEGHSTVSGNRRDMPETTTLTAQAPRGDEQTQIRDLRDEDGDGTVVETRLQYRKEGVYITYVKITATFSGGLTDVRELKPRRPELIAPTGVGPGSSASFVMEGSGTRAEVRIKALGYDKIAIGGSSVNALIVDTKIVFSGALKGEQNSTTWFWNKHILALKEQVSTDVTNGPIRAQNDYEAVLTKLP